MTAYFLKSCRTCLIGVLALDLGPHPTTAPTLTPPTPCACSWPYEIFIVSTCVYVTHIVYYGTQFATPASKFWQVYSEVLMPALQKPFLFSTIFIGYAKTLLLPLFGISRVLTCGAHYISSCNILSFNLHFVSTITVPKGFRVVHVMYWDSPYWLREY